MSHWLFAVEYLQVALKFPLILFELGEEEIQSKQRRNLFILVGVNLYFYAQIIVWTTLMLIYGYGIGLIYNLALLNYLVPASLLILSICLLKSQIKRLNRREIMARDMLIRVHTITFVFSVLVGAGSRWSLWAAYKAFTSVDYDEDHNTECRY